MQSLPSTPKVSVIIASYEQTTMLATLLRSLAAQDYDGEWEVLVCDDGSHGDLLSTVRRASDCYGLDVRVIWQPDRGFRASRSRNNGLRCAQGDIAILVDADCCVLNPNFVSAHVSTHDGKRRINCGSRRRYRFRHQQWEALLGLDAPTLAGVLGRCASQSDRFLQGAAFRSDFPWTACWSCNLSIAPFSSVQFDEAFEGWGFEDLEFGLRLTYEHEYLLSHVRSIEVFHIEIGPRQPPPLRIPSGHEAIVQLLRNMLQVLSRYPHLRLTPIEASFRYFELDQHSCRWRHRETPVPGQTSAECVARARAWLDAHDSGFGGGH
jgi:glycosyltransferase involved in cell wall biosynthesis